MLVLERVEAANWDGELRRFPGHSLCQSSAWLAFLRETQHGEPVLAAVKEGGQTVGCFAGMVVRRFGLRILGSPFPGWTTPYMGLALAGAVPRAAAVAALLKFAFGELGCAHVEMMDRELTADEPAFRGARQRTFSGYEIDLRQTEEKLFANMTSACRRCIRKAEKSGVVVEEASDEDFAGEYFSQLEDVFAKQRLVPTYGAERVRALIRNVQPTGRLLLIRACDPEGRCIATGIFPALSDTRAYFWGMASWRAHQILRPNEALLWYAMRYWRSRGVRFFDMGGSGEYKRKYGGYEIAVPWFRISKYPLIPILREAARHTVKLRQRVLARLTAGPASSAPAAIEAD